MKAVNELGEATSVPIILEPVSAGEMTRKKNACYLKKQYLINLFPFYIVSLTTLQECNAKLVEYPFNSAPLLFFHNLL